MTTTINASTSSGLVVTSDNSGVIQLQYNGQPGPAFNAAASGVGGPVTVATNANLIFNNIVYQRGGSNFNTSTGTFTAPVSGYYMFAVNILIDSSNGAADIDFQLYISGNYSGNSIYQHVNASVYSFVSASWVVSLSAGNTVYLVNTQASTKIYSGTGGDIQTHFSGFLIA